MFFVQAHTPINIERRYHYSAHSKYRSTKARSVEPALSYGRGILMPSVLPLRQNHFSRPSPSTMFTVKYVIWIGILIGLT